MSYTAASNKMLNNLYGYECYELQKQWSMCQTTMEYVQNTANGLETATTQYFNF